ncbi:MAG: TolC family protein [Gammaproteobacteria bacterium]|nr:TolC family protein [Gammaproteobacteria bacterium]MCY4358225.1 TolC family protein [Gammaproteobacteria bacterium]
MRILQSSLLLVVFSTASGPLTAQSEPVQELAILELMQSIRQHHPAIFSARASREQADTAVQRAQGAFDLGIEQNTLSRLNGYYDGQYFEQGVSQPLEIAGASIGASYRRSEGSFPLYEDFFNTLSGGELSLDLSFSLLRNRDIDARRTAMADAPLQQNIGELQEILTINQLLFDGLNTYLSWYRAFLETEALRTLVELAETRREAIESRVASGDLAAITLTEFETILLTRQIALQESLQRLLQSQQQLLFFWRDETGQTASLNSLVGPQVPLQWPFEGFQFDDQWQQQIIDNHPSIADLDAQLQIARNQERLTKNRLLPQLDIEMKLGNDFGSGNNYLNSPESYVGLNFSVPLQRNRAKAEHMAALARINEVEFDRQVQYDRLTVSLNESLLQLQTFNQLRILRRQQADIAHELEAQERIRFEEGDSDQFLLNTREAAAGQAELEAIAAEVLWLSQQLRLLALGINLLDY